MLTRFVRIQLIIFTIASIVGVLAMIIFYMQVPTLLGIGKMTVTVELPAAGGLYRFSNVTYRGVEVGKVTSVELTANGAKAVLRLNTSPKIPADLQADVRSISAVGEQYVDLRPRTDSPPYLHDGSVIAMRNTTIPQAVGPMLDQVSSLINSVPKDKLSALLDESFKGFNGAGYDLSSLADTSSKLTGDLNRVGDSNAALYNDTGPLLDSQAQTTDSIRTWARSLAGVTQQLVTDDPQFRTLLHQGPGAFDEVSSLLDQIKPTLPVLLANLTTIGQILRDVPPVVGATAGVAAPVGRRYPGGGPEPQSDRLRDGRLRDNAQRSGAVHSRFPSAVLVAKPGRHHHHRHPRRFVLQTAAGFTASGAGCPQRPVHGQAGQAGTNRGDLSKRRALPATGHAATRARPLPVRPEPCRAGRATR